MVVSNILSGRIHSNDDQWEGYSKFRRTFGVTVHAGVCATVGLPSHGSIEFLSEHTRLDFSGCGQPRQIGPGVKRILL